MNSLSFWKRSVYSALIFFGALVVLSVWYSALVWGLTTADKVGSGSGLTSASWNRIVDGVLDLDSRLSNVDTRVSNLSFSGGNVGIGTASPGAKLDVRGNTLLNWVGIWSRGRTALGTDTFSYDFVWPASEPLKIWASCSHWTSAYVALLETTITGDSYMGLSQWDQLNVSTPTQGGWVLSRPSNGTLRLTKTAGSYGGWMSCFITVMGPQIFTDQNP